MKTRINGQQKKKKPTRIHYTKAEQGSFKQQSLQIRLYSFPLSFLVFFSSPAPPLPAFVHISRAKRASSRIIAHHREAQDALFPPNTHGGWLWLANQLI